MKHKPATPLPWHEKRVHLNYHGHALMHAVKGGTRRLDNLSGQFDPEDAAYIAHAANAYPRLVEALRTCSRAANGLPTEADKDDARALLAELGE